MESTIIIFGLNLAAVVAIITSGYMAEERIIHHAPDFYLLARGSSSLYPNLVFY